MTDAERAAALAEKMRGIFHKTRLTTETYFPLTVDEYDTVQEALRLLAEQSAPSPNDPDPNFWHVGYPPKPFCNEWFIAKMSGGRRVVLTALPEEYSYDFKTVDETYIKKERIEAWAQFPDSEYVPFSGQPASSPAPADLREVVAKYPGRRVVSLGHGKYAISTGTYYDVPAVFIEDAPSPGPNGGNVPPEEREKIGYSAENAVIFTHQDNIRIRVIADLMCGDSFDAAISAAGYVILPREPTEVMINAVQRYLAEEHDMFLGTDACRALSRAALAAKE